MKTMSPIRFILFISTMFLWLGPESTLRAQDAPSTTAKHAPTILFIGNSFTFAAGSPVHYYRANTVEDLNHEGVGGVPALFKAFTAQAGLDYQVSLETSGGKNFDWHLANKAALIGREWDYVILQGYSTLDKDKPGDPAFFVRTAKEIADLLHDKNPKADIRVEATWSRADQTYTEKGHWHGQPIEKMALDFRAGCDLAVSNAATSIHSVIPVGEAWNRAFKAGVADPNPYDGIAFGQVDLWTYDHYHASAFGYYLSALTVFGDLTGLDPRSLGKNERTAMELGFSGDQTAALQQVAYDQLTAEKNHAELKPFKPVKLNSAAKTSAAP